MAGRPPKSVGMRDLDRRQFLRLAAGLGAASAIGMPSAALAAGGARPKGEWIAGDFHCHNVYIHDVWGGPDDDNTGYDEFYTHGHTPGEQIALAELRGLDFLAITDHNRVESIHAPDYRSDRLVLVPGYEHSLPHSDHAGVFLPSRDVLPEIISADGGTAAWLGEIHARGGMAVVNHPFYGNREAGDAIAWDHDVADSLRFDAVEVWNSMWLTRHDTVPLYEPDNHAAVGWWEQSFAPARRATALGGSDNHWKLLDGTAGVGQPTTWVYAPERSAAGVIAGVQAGRTSVSWQPPGMGGAQLLLDVVEEWSGRAAMIGGAVRGDGPLLAVATVLGLVPGQRLRLVSGGEVVHESVVSPLSNRVEVPVVLPEGGWLRAELLAEERYTLTALTSCVYADGRAPAGVRREPTRGRPVTYDGSGFAGLPAPQGVEGLPACSCAH
jgi:predicted metal-dependent phosphoesterase TrpH